jgi:hypothetical protein
MIKLTKVMVLVLTTKCVALSSILTQTPPSFSIAFSSCKKKMINHCQYHEMN